MHNLKNLFNKHIDAGLYPGVEWKIIHQNNIFEGQLGYLDLRYKKISWCQFFISHLVND